jgi:hypothetical protein
VARLYLTLVALLLIASCREETSLDSVIKTSKDTLNTAKKTAQKTVKTVKTVQETKKKIGDTIDALRAEKEKIDRKIKTENELYQKQVQEDLKRARSYISEETGYLLCHLGTTGVELKQIGKVSYVSILWLVNGVEVTRRHRICGSGGASLGVGLGGGGRPCSEIGGKAKPFGLYPYQVPQGSPADADFVCRLSFPRTAREAFKDLLDLDKESMAHVHSPPVKWPRIEGVSHTSDARYLGQLGLHNSDPVCRFGFWFQLHDQARIYTRSFSSSEAGVDGVVLIFRQFDRSRFEDEPSEMLAGWVSSEKASYAEEWVTEFNAHIQELLVIKHANA